MRRIVRFVLIVIASGLLAVLALIGTGWLAVQYQLARAQPYMSADAANLPNMEVGLVLGTAPITARRRLPTIVPNPTFVHRLDAAATLWRAGKVKYLLVSGNRTGDNDEPSAMRAGLIERGVPADVIYRDFAGYRTNDSMRRARTIFGLTRLVVVSQPKHVARALFLGHAVGIDAWGFEAGDEKRPVVFRARDELFAMTVVLVSYWDVLVGTAAREAGKPIAIGVDPPN